MFLMQKYETDSIHSELQHLITTNGEDLLKIKDVLASQASDVEYTDDASEREVDPTTDKGKEREGTDSPAASRLKASAGTKRSQGLRHSSPKSSQGLRRSDEDEKTDKRR